LRKVTDAKDAGDERFSINGKKGFEAGAELMFEQFESLKIVSVPRLYEFDDLAVFLAKVRSGQQVSFLPFAFAHEPDGTFGFLPHRTRSKTMYDIVQDWLAVSWRPGAAGDLDPKYCTDEVIKHATHRISPMSATGE